MAPVGESNHGPAVRRGPLRDETGVAKYRHEAIAVVLRVRARDDGGVCVLGVQRGRDPFAGLWALPSGPMEVRESLEEAVLRHLAARVDVDEVAHLEQLETRSEPGRDPYDRTVATAYLGLVPGDVEPALPPRAGWLPVEGLEPMAFDHHHLVVRAAQRLRAKLSYTNIAYAMSPEEFTIAQLRDGYEAVLGHDVGATNLQRILTRRGQLEPTGRSAPPGPDGGRPARLFRFTRRELEVTDPFAVLRP